MQTLTAITEWHPYAKMLPSAPVAIVVCGDPGDAKWAVLWEQDCSACTENLLIEAELLGLGAVWLGVHPLEERVTALRALLGIPEAVVPFAIVPLGWPVERKEPSDRYDRATRARRALVGRVDSLSRPPRGYLCHSTRARRVPPSGPAPARQAPPLGSSTTRHRRSEGVSRDRTFLGPDHRRRKSP